MRIAIFLSLVALRIQSSSGQSSNKNISSSEERETVVEARCRDQDDYVASELNRSDWMHEMRDELESVRLIDVKMVGSHNAASYSIHQPLDQYSVCQNARIRSQLAAGVRYVDLRVARGLRVGHGPHLGARFKEVIDEIGRFVHAHPKEFVLVSVKGTGWGSNLTYADRLRLRSTIDRALSDRMINRSVIAELSTATMGSIWRADRNALVLVEEALLLPNSSSLSSAEADDQDNNRIPGRSEVLFDPWANTDNADILFKRLDTYYENATTNRTITTRMFYVAQLLLTSAPLLTDGIDGLTKGLQASGRMERWLIEHPAYKIVFLDFVVGVDKDVRNSSRAIIDQVIRSNRKYVPSTRRIPARK